MEPGYWPICVSEQVVPGFSPDVAALGRVIPLEGLEGVPREGSDLRYWCVHLDEDAYLGDPACVGTEVFDSVVPVRDPQRV